MKKIHVCVYPAQNEGAVEINRALSVCEDIEVYGAASVRGHSEFNFKNYTYDIPSLESDAFIPAFNRFLTEHEIDLIFSTSDPVLLYFLQHQDALAAKVVNGDLRSAMICNNKKETYRVFMDCAFCPIVYPSFVKIPCFVKPIDGEGASGAKLITCSDDIPSPDEMANAIIVEYLPGREVTVDCFTDCSGELQAVLPRTRDKIFSGMSVVGTTFTVTEEIMSIAETINERLKMRGLWYFQIKQDEKNRYKLLEISMRCAGTMCQSRSRGVNLPLLSVYTAMEQKAKPVDNQYTVTLDRTLFARYRTDLKYDTVYIDYDGTVIVKDKVCLMVIRFLYQCKNNGKRIVLVTRHNEDHANTVYEDLERFGISPTLFDEIHCLSVNEEKSSVITQENALFIDNSYFERKKVHESKNIPVFSVDAIEVLQDWRL